MASDRATLDAQLDTLCARSHDLVAHSRRLRNSGEHLHRPALTVDNTIALQIKAIGRPLAPPQPIPLEPPTPAPAELHEAVLQALRAMVAVLDCFPLPDQVAMVKALTARTLLLAADQTRAPAVPVVLSA